MKNNMREVYLDNNATTAMAPEAFEAMRPFFSEQYGNPSSVHRQGRGPAEALRNARKQIASLLGCSDAELTVTSCGTESDNLAILGVLADESRRRHFVTSAVEHPAVINPLRHLETLGHELTVLGVNHDGQIDLNELRAAVREDTALVSLMMANNETGVLFPMDDIAAIVKGTDAQLHTDAVQAAGKISIDLFGLGVDLLALSAHKFHGPKGVGVMFVRKGTQYHPALLGGNQERGRRPGTENVAGVVAMATAFDLATKHREHYHNETRGLRDKFEREILNTIPDTVVNGGASPRLPNTSNICFRGIDSNAMLLLLDQVGISASAGSACKSGAGTPSPVLSAMGVAHEDAASSVRFSLSAMTTEADIDYVLEHVSAIIPRMRASSRDVSH